jgi:phage FluMu protein Com
MSEAIATTRCRRCNELLPVAHLPLVKQRCPVCGVVVIETVAWV